MFGFGTKKHAVATEHLDKLHAVAKATADEISSLSARIVNGSGKKIPALPVKAQSCMCKSAAAWAHCPFGGAEFEALNGAKGETVKGLKE